MERTVLINEIEEAFSGGSKLASATSAAQVSTDDGDLPMNEYINEYSLEQAAEHGLDPSLQGSSKGPLLFLSADGASSGYAAAASSSSGSSNSSGGGGGHRAAADPVLDEQLSILLNFLNSHDNTIVYGVNREEGEHTSRDILLSMKLTRDVFDPLLKSVKNNRQALHKTLLSQSLISGEDRASAAMSKKKRRELITEAKNNRRRNNKSRSNSLESNPSDVEGGGGGGGSASGAGKEEIAAAAADAYKNTLAAVVGKGVAEESVTSYLTTVCLLLSVMREERESTNNSGSNKSGAGGKKGKQQNAAAALDLQQQVKAVALSGLPVANVIGALFEKRSAGSGSNGGTGGSSKDVCACVPNPFRKYLLLSSSSAAAGAAMVGSVSPSQSASRPDSVAGSSLVALGDGEGDFDPGLGGLSMIEDGASGGLNSFSSFRAGDGVRSDAGTGTVSVVSDVSSEDGRARSPLSMLAANNSAAVSAISETTSHADADEEEEELLSAPMQTLALGKGSEESAIYGVDGTGSPALEALPDVPMLATYGPFCSANMHRDIVQQEADMGGARAGLPSIPCVPLEHVVVALLTVIASSADSQLGQRSAPLNSSSTSAGGAASPQNPLTSQLPTAPNAVNFLLFEYTLDVLLSELDDLGAAAAASTSMDNDGGVGSSSQPSQSAATVAAAGGGGPKGKGRGRGKSFDKGGGGKDKGRDNNKDAAGDTSSSSGHAAAEGGANNKSRTYFLVWAIGAVLKALSASLHAAQQQGLNANSLGLGALSDVNMKEETAFAAEGAMATGGGAAAGGGGKRPPSKKRGSHSGATGGGGGGMPFVFRLLRKVATCMGMPPFVAGEHNSSLDRSLSQGVAAAGASPSNNTSYPSHEQYRHFLRMVGIDTFMAGLHFFCPNAGRRGTLLRTLLQRAPSCTQAADYSPSMSPFLSLPSSLSKEAHPYKGGYYLLVALQKLCLLYSRDIGGSVYTVTSSLMPRGCFVEYGVPPPASTSIGSNTNSPSKQGGGSSGGTPGGGQQRSRSLSYGASPASSSSVRGSPGGADSGVMLMDKLNSSDSAGAGSGDQVISGTDGPDKGPDNGVRADGDDSPMGSLEFVLLSRLSDRRIMQHFSREAYYPAGSSTNSSSNNSGNNNSGQPHPCASNLFWGELELLRTMQRKHSKVFLEGASNADVKRLDWTFEGRKCSQNIMIADDSKSIMHRSQRVWSTVLGNEALAPNSGVYEWAVQVEASEKGHLFMGLATNDASTDSYVGCDRSGWGLIGTKALWHNKQKVRSNYGTGFAAGSVVHVRYDSDRHTLSFSVPTRDWGVAFSDLPDKVMYPAVSVFQQEDVVSIPAAGPDGDRPRTDLRVLQTPLVQYTQALCAHTSRLLQYATTGGIDEHDKELVMRHPFVGLLLPALAANLVSPSFQARNAGIYPAMQLLPSLSVVAKLLSAVYGNSPSRTTDKDMMGDIRGEWVLRSNVASTVPALALPPKEHKLVLRYDDEDNEEEGGSKGSPDGNSSSTSDVGIIGARKVRGRGSSVVASVTVDGAQMGSRLCLREVWTVDDGCGTLEGSLSLCGCFFSGTFTDSISGKVSRVTGRRALLAQFQQQLQDNLESDAAQSDNESYNLQRACVVKVCALTLVACSRLAASLTEGIKVAPTASNSADAVAVMSADTAPAAGGGDATNGTNGSGGNPSSNKKDRDWLSSELFSGGMRLDASLVSTIVRRLCTHSTRPSSSNTGDDGDGDDGDYGEDNVTKGSAAFKAASVSLAAQSGSEWDMSEVQTITDLWVSTSFPITKHVTARRGGGANSKGSSSSLLGPEDKNVAAMPSLAVGFGGDSLLTEDAAVFSTAQGYTSDAGQKVDDFLSHHTGQAHLKRMGGEPLQAMRRAVLAALARACGCLGLCAAEYQALVDKEKSNSDRPSAPLLDVWRAAKRVVEHAIKSKQETGLPYSSVCDHLSKKAALLLDLQPCEGSVETAEDFSMLHNVTSVECWSSEAAVGAQQNCSRVVSEAVDFFLSPLTDLASVWENLTSRAITAVTRAAAYRSLLMLLQKQDGPAGGHLDVLPAITSPWLQAYAAVHLAPSAQQYRSQRAAGSSDASSHGSTKAGGAGADSTTAAPANKSSTSSPSVHYSDGLNGTTPALMDELESAFESAHAVVTNTLQRCAWNRDRSGQSMLLRVWQDMEIQPADHAFLNTVGIFRVLQTILEGARGAMRDAMPDVNNSPRSRSGTLTAGGGGDTDYASTAIGDMAAAATKRLSQLALQVVHSLAAQVAFSKEHASGGGGVRASGSPTGAGGANPNKAVKLQRSVSGPDTLSQSLFDMLFHELYSEVRMALLRIGDNSNQGAGDVLDSPDDDAAITTNVQQHQSTTAESTSNQATAAAEADSDKYLFQLLRLLFTVSSSKVCQRSLSSPKWLSLLLSFLGFGSFGVQRRVMRLLRRVLSGLDPTDLEAHIPHLFSNDKPAVLDDACIDDEDARSLIGIGIDSGDTMLSCAELLVRTFLEGVSVVVPLQEEGVDRRAGSWLMKHLHATRGARTFSVECTNVLKELQGIPKWRVVIASVLCSTQGGLGTEPLSFSATGGTAATTQDKEDEKDVNEGTAAATTRAKIVLERQLRSVAAVALLGGVVDCFRLGGQALIRPFNFVDPSSSYASTLAASSHTSGMVVAKHGSSYEVVEMERFTKLSLDAASQEVVIHHSAYLTSNLPIRTVRVGAADLTPAGDVHVFPEVISPEIFRGVLAVLKRESVGWMLNRVDGRIKELADAGEDNEGEGGGEVADPTAESEPPSERPSEEGLPTDPSDLLSQEEAVVPPGEVSDDEAVQVLLHSFSFKSAAHLSSAVELARSIIVEQPALLLQLLDISVKETAFGGLNVIEEVEARWNALWNAYADSGSGFDAPPDSGSGSGSPRGGRGERGGSDGGLMGGDADIIDRLEAAMQDRGGGLTAGSILAALTQATVSAGGVSGGNGGGGGDEGSPRSILMEAAAASGIFNPFLGLRAQPQVDQATQTAAIAQMVDIGLPPEWCEVALRRCRWNVEMAINLCFEHGEGMAQIVAEDQMMQQARAQQQQLGGQQQEQQAGGVRRRVRGRGQEEPAPAPAPRRRDATINSTSSSGSAAAPNEALVQQLQDMGFPRAWCVRALVVAGGDVDSALSYILSHADELGATASEETTASITADDENKEEEGEPPLPPINPLMCVSGEASIMPDLTCSGTDGFPSVGCRGFGVTKGKWYYEVTLITAGCVQIGWVDHAYASDPDSGEGVGDCKHSWAYDGWRMYLWNELAIEWGARWKEGDVVGCLLDMDERVMSFTLNGFAGEIGMGEAFRDFDFLGGVFPCVSFNRHESVGLNFGSNAFKHSPPRGYRAFIEHVNVALQPVQSFRDRLLSRPIAALFGCNKKSGDNDGNNKAAVSRGIGRDDSMEESSFESCSLKGSNGNAALRYFHNGDNFTSENRSMPRPTRSTLPSGALPSGRGPILKQLLEVSRDLSVLYCRLTMLRVFYSVSLVPGEKEQNAAKAFVSLLIQPQKEEKEHEDNSIFMASGDGDSARAKGRTTTLPLHKMLALLKLCTVTSSRTKVHNLTMSLLPPLSAFPKNLGTIFSSGGAPLMGYLSDALADLVAASRDAGEESVMDEVIDALEVETSTCAVREHGNRWEDKHGLAPLIYDDSASDATALKTPSLLLALWLTATVADQLAEELASFDADLPEKAVAKKAAPLVVWLERLVQCWAQVMKAASVDAKLCATQVLLALLQSVVSTTGSLTRLPSKTVGTLLRHFDYERLCRITLVRLESERFSYPICSEYLQALTELTSVVHYCFPMAKEATAEAAATTESLVLDAHDAAAAEEEEEEEDPGDSPIYRKRGYSVVNEPPTSETAGTDSGSHDLYEDCEEASYDAEALRGQVLSENGWDVYTGTIHQLAVPAATSASTGGDKSNNRRRQHERNDAPPALQPGDKVSRKVSVVRTVQITRPVASQGSKKKRDSKETDEAAAGASQSNPFDGTGLESDHDDDDDDGPDPGAMIVDGEDSMMLVEEEEEEEVVLLAESTGRSDSVIPEEEESEEEEEMETVEEKVTEWLEQVGEVLEIAAWEGQPPGTARLVRWDAISPDSVASGTSSTSPPRSPTPGAAAAAAAPGTINAWIEGGAKSADKDKESSSFSEKEGEDSAQQQLPQQTTELMRWDVFAGDFGDMRHVELNRDGTAVAITFPNPTSETEKVVAAGLGQDLHFGAILRIRRLPSKDKESEEELQRLVGVLELPDFSAEILVRGHYYDDGSITFTEEKLLSGPRHATWVGRFGQPFWSRGASFDLQLSNSCRDRTDGFRKSFVGTSSHRATIGARTVNVVSDMTLQAEHLFHFDPHMKASIVQLSADKMSASRPPRVGGGNSGCVFGNVGFCGGVHYWEVKIECADVGSVFIGIAEKQTPLPGMLDISSLRRKVGMGVISNRTAYRAPSGGSISERAYVYGENFHTGDTVGVHLDMNKGVLSFFLDGLKYGEHSISDLGPAFDSLRSPEMVKLRTYFPMVGLFSSQDRVTLTPRWLSSMTTRSADELEYVDKTWGLLNSWSLERRANNQPSKMHRWVYREGWRNWIQWRSNLQSRVRTRCKSIPIDINVTPRACVEASIRLGLSRALYRGDRFVFTKSQGRDLELKEEAVVLGAYKGQLWYRLDTQQGDSQKYGELVESGSFAWSLAVTDIEDILLLPRPVALAQAADNPIPESVRNIVLARGPDFHGALLDITCETGSVMRNGVEIDSAEELCRIPTGTRVLALERRMNTSNITRFKVLYEGQAGWISERMRGGTEDMMVDYVISPTPAEMDQMQQETLATATAMEYKGTLEWNDAKSLAEAMQKWEQAVEQAGHVSTLLQAASALDASAGDSSLLSFDSYLELSTTLDGTRQWTVEADMQLSELISQCASKNGVVPSNLSCRSLEAAVKAIDSRSSPLRDLDPARVVARAALLRVANKVIGYALPYLNLSLPEEKVTALTAGVSDLVDVIPSDLSALQDEEDFHRNRDGERASGGSSPSSPARGAGGGNRSAHTSGGGGGEGNSAGSSPARRSGPDTPSSVTTASMRSRISRRLRRANSGGGVHLTCALEEGASSSPTGRHHRVVPEGRGFSSPLPAPLAGGWAPACSARRLRSLRRLLFSQTKVLFWEAILESTTTPTNLHQDEYEDPREIRTLEINRVKATESVLSNMANTLERLKQTQFGQVHRETRGWPNASFRRSYLGKGHGGQKRAFKVRFQGEGVNDYGGPYRALFEGIVDEVQSDQFAVGRKPSERCLLPLMVPCNNRAASVGANQDKFVLTTGNTTPLVQDLALFFGKTVGTAARHNLTLGIDLSALQWRSLVRLPLSLAHLETVDYLTCQSLRRVTQLGLEEEYRARCNYAANTGSATAKEGENDHQMKGEATTAAPDLGLEYTQRIPEEWSELRFNTYLPDGSKKELLPGGDTLPVMLGNWREYVTLMEQVRLKESSVMLKSFRAGLSAVLPVELLPIFTAREMEVVISGHSDVNIDLLKRCTEYDDIDPAGETVQNFWRVINDFSNEERTLFLRFVWARSRLPTSLQGFDMNFRLQGPQGAAKESKNDDYLPHAQTCFFSLSLPHYSSYEKMKEKILYAIHNSPNMDADVRLHSAEGFDI